VIDSRALSLASIGEAELEFQMPVFSRSLVLFLCLLVLSVVACSTGGRGGGDDDDDGDDCFTDADCSAGAEYCKATDPSVSPEGVCQSLESAGDACTLGSHCVSGLFCLVDNTDGTCSSAPSACDDGPSCSCDPMLNMCAPGGLSCDGSGDSVTLHCYNGLAAGGGDDDDDDDDGDDDDTTSGDADGTIPCSAGAGTATVDVWEVTGAGTLRVDTISAGTTFDPVAWFSADPNFTLSETSPLGDDEFDCTFPPPEWSCPQLDAPGAGYLVVAGYAENCNSSGIGSYSVSGPLGAQAADDIEVSTEGG